MAMSEISAQKYTINYAYISISSGLCEILDWFIEESNQNQKGDTSKIMETWHGIQNYPMKYCDAFCLSLSVCLSFCLCLFFCLSSSS